jgi:hypothetical protein
MSTPGSRAKRSSSSVKGRPRSLSIASNILRSSSLNNWGAASRSDVSGGDDSSGWNTAINAAAVAKLLLSASDLFFPARTTGFRRRREVLCLEPQQVATDKVGIVLGFVANNAQNARQVYP